MKITNVFIPILVLSILVFLLSGCSTIPKTVYFQGDTSRIVPLKVIKPSVVRIKSNDILGITVTSISEDVNKLFELQITGGLRYSGYPNVQSNGMGMQPIGYEVDSIGNVELPIVGTVSVNGLSCSEAADTIRNRLNRYLKNPTTNVRILNHRFTILGEVARPATYNIVDNSLSIVEAIGMAGDLTIYGRRDNVILIREERGKREQVRLNLLSREILSSPYYHLKNGDIIYIEPSVVKSTSNDRSYQMLPIVTSVISAVTSLGVLILSLSRL